MKINHEFSALPRLIILNQLIQLFKRIRLDDGFDAMLGSEVNHFPQHLVTPDETADDSDITEDEIMSGDMKSALRK